MDAIDEYVYRLQSDSDFYHAVHFSAKHGHGLAIAYRPSVCPSVTLVICDHISWKNLLN